VPLQAVDRIFLGGGKTKRKGTVAKYILLDRDRDRDSQVFGMVPWWWKLRVTEVKTCKRGCDPGDWDWERGDVSERGGLVMRRIG
jgi:hypothetical protein